ncbi:hypothetical protein U1Q18_007169 [Sarracenia purpurea var. burkii]
MPLQFLPPKIARTVSHLVDQKTQLEDASGKRSTVTISQCNGSLAFQQGWQAFSLEHGLQVGDFIVFHYIVGSHFVVQIYGKNGCEKTIFSDENDSRKKRTRTNRHFRDQAGKFISVDSDSMNKQGSNTSAVSGSNTRIQPMATDNTLNVDNGNGRLRPFPRIMCTEEPFYMIDRDARDRQEDYPHSLYDLSKFEMQTSVVERSNRVLDGDIPPCSRNKMPKSQAGVAGKITLAEEVVRSLALLSVPNFATPERNEGFQTMENLVSGFEKDSGIGDTFGLEQRRREQSSKDQVLISQKKSTPLMHISQSVQQKLAGGPEFCGLPTSVQTQKSQSGKYPEIGEFDPVSNHGVKDQVHVGKVVKTEPVDTFELSSTDAVQFSFLMATDMQSFVVLPSGMPSVSFKRRSRIERKVVVLIRDPELRLWPVLYHEKYGLKVLTSGWQTFVEVNNIRPGDECVFEVENESECIYRVGIVHS